MKKILYILHYPPPVHGAAIVGKYIMESALINNNFNGRYINLGTSRSVDEIGKGGIIKWLRYFNVLFNTFLECIRFSPNLVYLTLTANGAGFYKDALVALIAKCLGCKVVYHFHNKGVINNQNKWFDNLLYKLVLKKAQVILLSPYLYYDIKKYVSKSDVHYCANGIPKLPIGLNENKESSTIEILFLSNLLKAKGVYILLEACSLLKNKNIDIKCTVIGGEGDISVVDFENKIIELKLTDVVYYAGKQYGDDKLVFFEKADIFVHPTYNDCFPLVLLEAMQFGLPIVSTIEGAIPEIVESQKNGFLVPKKEALAFANEIEKLVLNPDLRSTMSQSAKLKYNSKFTTGAFEDRLCKILKNIT
ncbi:Glycosyltransferase involved in cell wall bisynthesis [Arenibacter nanhaiticus]|uniref:Glycosyltransferase involved in cell wall bisynthesis n=1 Tax=Arenibacter nanhaiticus TaxID=558155 RepID=A0A1M6LZ28_9FLAO|nr:glycosyltransferase [Arenibacter nanhaiticus]SHJ76479.1 Glycosyltransferase involved in cell wall bisynthesis [Arenibacter nanhaiticus]